MMKVAASVLAILAALTAPAAACWQSGDTRVMIGLDDDLEDEEALIFTPTNTEDCVLETGAEDAPGVASGDSVQIISCDGGPAETAIIHYETKMQPAYMSFRQQTFLECQ